MNEEKYWENKEEFEWLTTKNIQSILSSVPTPTGYTLELCSGSGMFTKFMNLKQCNQYTCLDISQKLLNRLNSLVPGIETIKADAQKLNFNENSYDNIYIFAGLHHLPKLDMCLKNSYRILKKNGKFICFEPNADCFYRSLMLKLRSILKLYTTDEIFLKPLLIAQKLTNFGFKNINIKYLTPNYNIKHIGILYPIFIIMKLISILPGRHFQTFFLIICEK